MNPAHQAEHRCVLAAGLSCCRDCQFYQCYGSVCLDAQLDALSMITDDGLNQLTYSIARIVSFAINAGW